MKKSMLAVLALVAFNALAYDPDSVAMNADRQDSKILKPRATSGKLLSLKVVKKTDLKEVKDAKIIEKLKANYAKAKKAAESSVGVIAQPIVYSDSCYASLSFDGWTVSSKTVDENNNAVTVNTDVLSGALDVSAETSFIGEQVDIDVAYYFYDATNYRAYSFTDAETVFSDVYGDAGFSFGWSFEVPRDYYMEASADVYGSGNSGCGYDTTRYYID